MDEKVIKAFDLTGKTALITGGGSGIGKGAAKVLAAAGANVFIVGRREGKLIEVRKEIEGNGGTASYISMDLSAREGCEAAAEACVRAFGAIDILVNSAGSRGAHGTVEEELTEENYRETMAADLDSTFFMIAASLPELRKTKGAVINIASLAALSARGPIVYSAAKGAVKSMGRTLAKRLGPDGIRVNTIYPGFIVTEMTERIREFPDKEAAVKADSALGILGEVDDIAYCVLYLSSSAAHFVTGQDFVVDGGTTCI